MNKPKRCPILSLAAELDSVSCRGDRCAWFHLEYHQDGDFTNGKCVLLRIADRLSNSQALTNLDKKTVRSADTTTDGKETPHSS